jgi:PTS system mannose-specific IIA component
MVKILVLSHGDLAKELVEAAGTIAGATPGVEALCLPWTDDFETARIRTSAVVEGLDPREGLLILTDMYGGTPYNIAISFADSPKVQVVSGVNLPMVLRLCCLADCDLGPEELARWIQQKGQRSICLQGEANGLGTPSLSATVPEKGGGDD